MPHQPIAADIEGEFRFTDTEFRFLAELVRQRTGIVLQEHKRSMVYSRLARRLRILGLDDFAQYCSLLQQSEGEEEIAHLVNAITTNLTHFFREIHHFEHLRDEVLRPAAQSGGGQASRKLRIWSAGCSMGAEPYSIAMTLHDVFGSKAGWDIRILATDIDSNMLDIGRRGVYSREMCEKIPDAYRKYMHEHGAQECVMDPRIREMISFKSLNLMDAQWPMKGVFDAIFCRNVVIYFDKETQRVLFERIANLLTPQGWLYIGHSESLYKVSERFELAGRTVYRRIA